MNDSEFKFYKNLAKLNRGTTRQIGYGSLSSQWVRFEVLFKAIQDICGTIPSRILDFGCGRGDLLKYLHSKSCDVARIKYIGIDAIEENIADAKTAWPNNRFDLFNYDGASELPNTDIAMFSGCFSTTPLEDIKKIYTRLIEAADIGVVGNFLLKNPSMSYEEGCLPRNLEELMTLIPVATHTFTIIGNYLPHDVTIAIQRRQGRK